MSKKVYLVAVLLALVPLYGLYRQWGRRLVVESLAMEGEFLIAFAILWEIEEGRLFNFWTTLSAPEARGRRRQLYNAYFHHAGETKDLDDRSENFCKYLLEKLDDDKQRKARDKIREICDAEINHLDRLGYLWSNSLFRRSQFVRTYPHTVIFCWTILRVYVDKRRENGGPSWAFHFIEFTLSCVKFVLRQAKENLPEKNPLLRLQDLDGEHDVEFGPEALKKMKKDLAARVFRRTDRMRIRPAVKESRHHDRR